MGSKFKNLSTYHRALATFAVLVDGFEAQKYLEIDEHAGEDLALGATELARLKPELRMPFLGTQLRLALEELEKSKDEH